MNDLYVPSICHLDGRRRLLISQSQSLASLHRGGLGLCLKTRHERDMTRILLEPTSLLNVYRTYVVFLTVGMPNSDQKGCTNSSWADSNLSAGRYCLLCPKSNAGIAALFGSLGVSLGRSFHGSSKHSNGGLQQRIDALVQSAQRPLAKLESEEGSSDEDEGRKHRNGGIMIDTNNALGANAWNRSPHTWHLGHGSAAVVHFGLFEVVGGINRVQPSVFYNGSNDETMFCVFQGYLSNLEELIDRYYSWDSFSAVQQREKKKSARDSPTAVIMGKKTPGEKSAELLYTMFCDERNGDDPLIVLSELQGQYAFAMFDGDRKQVFAARDSSGKERLYFEIDDDGGVTITNSETLQVNSADGLGHVSWEELPPGHYLSGKPIKVHQFALTPEEMKEREYNDAVQDNFSIDYS